MPCGKASRAEAPDVPDPGVDTVPSAVFAPRGLDDCFDASAPGGFGAGISEPGFAACCERAVAGGAVEAAEPTSGGAPAGCASEEDAGEVELMVEGDLRRPRPPMETFYVRPRLTRKTILALKVEENVRELHQHRKSVETSKRSIGGCRFVRGVT